MFVTNHNDFPFTDMFDGEEYILNPGEKVLMTEAAAAHIFGYGSPDKASVLVRLGWAAIYDPDKKTMVEHPNGAQWLANFTFTPAKVVEDVPAGLESEESPL